ncbi:MAG TPA: hypothetical protein VJU79_09505 [Candidatus Dormibacteraeota bacterium]|nr:hypothetical protein [Candidatus Dormibacteraeota bacterium]
MFGTKRVVVGAVTIAIALAIPTGALANPTGNHGQPNQSCEEQPTGPPGFNTGGFANAKSVYANNDGTPAVSQYDVACFQLSQQHGP